ncbi:MAG: hypothetical protein ACJ79A_00260 [Gemmatimonadaceae bacterium]
MRSSVLFSLTTLSLTFATIAAPSADAQVRPQSRNAIIVCRDGTRFDSNDISVCDHHRGVDARATDVARRNDNDRWNNRRDNRDDRRDGRDDRWDDRRNGDPRYDPNNRNDRGYGYGARREVYEWDGVVDREIQIQLRGNRAYVQPIGAGEDRNSRGRVINGMPQQTGNLVVQRIEGRGDVDVIEQPSSRNGYTATLRIRDPRSGAARYRIVAYWEPPARYGFGR